jgi:hypothetical protein
MNDISLIKYPKLQIVIADLKLSSRKLFARQAGDPGAVEDYLTGQEACLRALRFMQNNPVIEYTDSDMYFIITSNWYNTRFGCTKGTGMSCEHLLRYLENAIAGSAPPDDSSS